jgi:hypothetical protein
VNRALEVRAKNAVDGRVDMTSSSTQANNDSQALPRPKTVLGPGDPAQIHSPCGAECRNPETIRMAHVPAHVLDSATKCRNRIQSDARAASAFDLALNVGRLHAGDYPSETCSASSSRVASLFFRCEWRIILCRTGNCCYVAHREKGHKKGAECALFVPSMVSKEFA